jgi:hypothetical protein
VVHVTQGSFTTDTAALTTPTIQALADDDLLVVVTCPDPDALGTLPRNVRTAGFIPHRLLLPHVDVMVTNAGYNGTLTALAHGVPLVCAGREMDRADVSARVACRGRHRPQDRHADRRPDRHRRPHDPAAPLLPRPRAADPGRLRDPPARPGGGRAFGTPRCEQIAGDAHDQRFKELVDKPRRFAACCTRPRSCRFIRSSLPPPTQRPGWLR